MLHHPGAGLAVPSGPGLRHGAVIPEGELLERFSRSSGPGGQGVNTTDSRVELVFDPATSTAFSPDQRDRLLTVLASRLVAGRIVVVASELRSQRRNRAAARARLVRLLREALAPPPPRRRATRPTRGSQHRRLETKRQRAQLKSRRGRVAPD